MTLLLLLILAVGGITALLVISISIVEAPWPLLLGILVVGLLFIRWESGQGRAIAPSSTQRQQASEDAAPPSPHEEASSDAYNTDGARIYRGIRYTEEHSTSDNTDVSDSHGADYLSLSSSTEDANIRPDGQPPSAQAIEGVYRGQHWQRSRGAQIEGKSLLPDITYRGRKVSPHAQAQHPPPTDGSDSLDV